jgi:hypothetical protein
MKVSLIPWFMLSGRPYPVFTYLYAIWHYNHSVRKSMAMTAALVGQIFGIESFNKSTVCRSTRAMEQLLNDIQIDRPLDSDTGRTEPVDDLLARIPELLKVCPSVEALAETCGVRVGRLPVPVNRTVSYALGSIPRELSIVTKDDTPGPGKKRDTRKRPARQRKKNQRTGKYRPVFAESQQAEQIRIAFIAQCRTVVLDAAVTYHRFMI